MEEITEKQKELISELQEKTRRLESELATLKGKGNHDTDQHKESERQTEEMAEYLLSKYGQK